MANLIEVKVPDIGDFTDIPVIEILVKVGDTIKKEDSLVSLESDKATMEVPASHSGVVKEIKVKLGDKVSMGAVVLLLEESAGAMPSAEPPPKAAQAETKPAAAPPPPTQTHTQTPAPAYVAEASAPRPASTLPPQPSPLKATNEGIIPAHVHASPSIRKLAREFGVDLGKVKGSALKGRITEDDVMGFVKTELAKPSSSTGAAGGGFARGVLQFAAAQAVFGAFDDEAQQEVGLGRGAGEEMVEAVAQRGLDQAGGLGAGEFLLGLALELGFADEGREFAGHAGQQVLGGDLGGAAVGAVLAPGAQALQQGVAEA